MGATMVAVPTNTPNNGDYIMTKAIERYGTYANMKWNEAFARRVMDKPDYIRPFRHCNARLYYQDGLILLVSYSTPVAIAGYTGSLVMLNPEWFSNTTTRHVRWFLQDFCGINNP